jgi:hypothetical protein
LRLLQRDMLPKLLNVATENDMRTPAELRELAEARFKKRELQRIDGCAAMAEYEAAGRATIEKTARLKALRLSRDVVVQPAAAASPSKQRRRTKSRAGSKAATAA